MKNNIIAVLTANSDFPSLTLSVFDFTLNDFTRTTIPNNDIANDYFESLVSEIEHDLFLNLSNTGLKSIDVDFDFMLKLRDIAEYAVDKPLGIRSNAQYYAFALSLTNPNKCFLALETSRIKGETSKTTCFMSLEDAPCAVFELESPSDISRHLSDFDSVHDIGSGNLCANEIFRNGHIVGALSPNGRLNNCSGWSSPESRFIDDFLTDEEAAKLWIEYKA